MELKLTFEDGSEGLTHYGVKGMKWGKHLFGDDPNERLDRNRNLSAINLVSATDRIMSIARRQRAPLTSKDWAGFAATLLGSRGSGPREGFDKVTSRGKKRLQQILG